MTTTVVTTTTTTTTTTETKTETKVPTSTHGETKKVPTVAVGSKGLGESEVLFNVNAKDPLGGDAPSLIPDTMHDSKPDRDRGEIAFGAEGETDADVFGNSDDRAQETDESEGHSIEEHYLPLPQPITRRNTTGSITTPLPPSLSNQSLKKKPPSKSALSPSTHVVATNPDSSLPTHATTVPNSTNPSFPLPLQAGFGEGSVELASDIFKISEKIRRERNLKRAKQMEMKREMLSKEKRLEVGVAAAAAASTAGATGELDQSGSPTGTGTGMVAGGSLFGPLATTTTTATTRGPGDEVVEENPLVGNLIGEGHVNYVLMYNMLTGIRIAVSRCGGKMMRPLGEEDFRAEHKYSFDMYVLLPSSLSMLIAHDTITESETNLPLQRNTTLNSKTTHPSSSVTSVRSSSTLTQPTTSSP